MVPSFLPPATASWQVCLKASLQLSFATAVSSVTRASGMAVLFDGKKIKERERWRSKQDNDIMQGQGDALCEPNGTASRKFWLEKTNANKEAKWSQKDEGVGDKENQLEDIWYDENQLMHSFRLSGRLQIAVPKGLVIRPQSCQSFSSLMTLRVSGNTWILRKFVREFLRVSWAINCLILSI